jgi:hypothetical protein
MEARRGGEGGGSTKATYNKERGWPTSKEGEAPHREATLEVCNNIRQNTIPYGRLHTERQHWRLQNHLLRSWVLIFKELRKLPPSFMYIPLTTLPNLSIPDAHFLALLSTVSRSRFQVKAATFLIPIDLVLVFVSFMVSVPKLLLS